MNILIVIDMQNDFINGSLGTKEAVAIVPTIQQKIQLFDGEIIFTRDTHDKHYLQSKEGQSLPIEHCIKGTEGWMIQEDIFACAPSSRIIDKPTFGSLDLVTHIQQNKNFKPAEDKIELVGVCTDICVVTNALLLKTYFYETDICVHSNCCAGITPSSHQDALNTMKSCQIRII